ncbi:MAG: AAA family ATPase, partial [Verrucomicrobiota bacterium]
IGVLVIDNLSSVSNISENDNDEWMKLGDWLLDFRRKGISVVVVHHAGRNGNMRGASRREDPAFWIIRLDDSKERTSTDDGARFVSTFTKCRNSRLWPTPLDWHVSADQDGEFSLEYENAGTDELVYQCIKDGLDRCSDIATELDLTKGTVSKSAQKLESSGRISISGKGNQSRYSAN